MMQIKAGVDLKESSKITESIKTSQGHKFTVPRGIRPILAKHRVEVCNYKITYRMTSLVRKIKYIT